ncbi:MAG: tetratricopeptide repeat protein [Anaerolineae bacterium]|nr:tetratricopeptide repeat protein [Anaerolineae bacterium]
MTQPNSETRPTSPGAKLEYAIHLARTGHKLEARDMLRSVVALQPVNQAAWLWLSAVTTDRNEAEAALAQARQVNPAHPSLAHAEQWLAHRFANQPATQESVVVKTPLPATVPLSPFSKLFNSVNSFVFGVMITVIVAGLSVLLWSLGLEVKATVQTGQTASAGTGENNPTLESMLNQSSSILDEAQAQRDWAKAITVLEELRRIEPNNPPLQTQLAYVYLQRGLTLRHKGYVDQALADFEQVLSLNPQHAQARQEAQMAQDYLVGIQHYQEGRWQEAIAALEAVWAANEEYTNVQDLLFSATYNHGLALQAAGELSLASSLSERKDFQQTGFMLN